MKGILEGLLQSEPKRLSNCQGMNAIAVKESRLVPLQHCRVLTLLDQATFFISVYFGAVFSRMFFGSGLSKTNSIMHGDVNSKVSLCHSCVVYHYTFNFFM